MTAPQRLRTLQSSGYATQGSLAADIGALGPWFHNLHLHDGVQTAPDHPLGDFPRNKWDQLAPELPQDLKGARVLDVGCNAGFYTFELARRGARVVGLDTDDHYLRQAQWASRLLGHEAQVELKNMQVYELARVSEQFDIVLFLGVFYHLRYPTLALDIVTERAKQILVFQSLSLRDGWAEPQSRPLAFEELEALNATGWPKLAFIETELAGDPTNWWVPNRACIELLLRSAGWHITSRPGHELFVCHRRDDAEEAVQSYREQLDHVLGRASPNPLPNHARNE
jgi:tRNA (mo5U34)-methyltransferase